MAEAQLTLIITARSATAANRMLDDVSEDIQGAVERIVEHCAARHNVKFEWVPYPAASSR